MRQIFPSVNKLPFIGLARGLGSTLAVLLLTAVLTGCQNYRLGTGEDALPFNRLYVEPVLNRTTLPQAEVHLTQQIPVEFNRLPTSLTLVNQASSAEATLQVILTDFRRQSKVAQEDDTGLTRKFEWVLQARVTLAEPSGEKTFFSNRPIVVRTDVFDEGDILAAEIAATPLVTQELAKAIAREVTQVW